MKVYSQNTKWIYIYIYLPLSLFLVNIRLKTKLYHDFIKQFSDERIEGVHGCNFMIYEFVTARGLAEIFLIN